MSVVTMVKDDREVFCNASQQSINELSKYGWKLKEKKKSEKKTKKSK